MRNVIAVDFDGTICENAFPEIGEPIEDTISFVKYAKSKGYAITLWTCREGKLLEDAVEFCKNLGLEFDAVNENLPERTDAYGNDCRKIGATIYLDDRSIHPLNLSCTPWDLILSD